MGRKTIYQKAAVARRDYLSGIRKSNADTVLKTRDELVKFQLVINQLRELDYSTLEISTDTLVLEDIFKDYSDLVELTDHHMEKLERGVMHYLHPDATLCLWSDEMEEGLSTIKCNVGYILSKIKK